MAKAIENKGHLSLFEYGWAVRYGIAPIMVALGLAVRSLLAPVMTGETVYTYFVPSVLVSAWLGGLGPGLVATVPQCPRYNLFAYRRAEPDNDVDR